MLDVSKRHAISLVSKKKIKRIPMNTRTVISLLMCDKKQQFQLFMFSVLLTILRQLFLGPLLVILRVAF